jgi:hypothetical protein
VLWQGSRAWGPGPGCKSRCSMLLPPICTGQGCLVAAGTPILPCSSAGWNLNRPRRAPQLYWVAAGCTSLGQRHMVKSTTACGCRTELVAGGCGCDCCNLPGMQRRRHILLLAFAGTERRREEPQRPTSDMRQVPGTGLAQLPEKKQRYFPRGPTEDLDSVGGAGTAEDSRLAA